MPITTLSDDLWIAIFTVLDQWDLPKTSQVCQHWRFLVTQTSSLWLDVHDDDGYYYQARKNPPFQIALKLSRGADVRFIDNKTGKLGGALQRGKLNRATGLVLVVDARKAYRLVLRSIQPQTPLFKLRSLHLHLKGYVPDEPDRLDFGQLNEINLPALRHFGLAGVEYPLEDISLPNLLTLHVEIVDHQREICALVRRCMDRPLRELWFRFRMESSINLRGALPEDVAKRLGELDAIYARLAQPKNEAMHSDRFQQLLAVTTAEVRVTTVYYQQTKLDPAQAIRSAEALLHSYNNFGPPPLSKWTVCVAEQWRDDFGRPIVPNVHALTIRSGSVGLVRHITFKRDRELGDQLVPLLCVPEVEHLEVDGISMWNTLRSACQELSIHKLGTPKITTLTIRISAHDKSISMEKILQRFQGSEIIGRTLDGLDTLVVRARPFEQVNVRWNDLVALIQLLQLPQEGKVVHVRTAGVWLQRAAGNDRELPPGVILDG